MNAQDFLNTKGLLEFYKMYFALGHIMDTASKCLSEVEYEELKKQLKAFIYEELK